MTHLGLVASAALWEAALAEQRMAEDEQTHVVPGAAFGLDGAPVVVDMAERTRAARAEVLRRYAEVD